MPAKKSKKSKKRLKKGKKISSAKTLKVSFLKVEG
jgi:hypothetical protein